MFGKIVYLIFARKYQSDTMRIVEMSSCMLSGIYSGIEKNVTYARADSDEFYRSC